MCVEMPKYCDCYDKWVWPSGESEDWEETWEPASGAGGSMARMAYSVIACG
jgi:hypothetical protein